ncbi:MAG: phospholipid carrier-dependent glycosyltransferase [Polyangiaceae bacterium]|nr:phospholipid carrier-dependent glycosyltransferase [Polyangiaceae bacterium]
MIHVATRGVRWLSAWTADATFAAGLFVFALALRLAAAFTLAAEPVWDGQYYDFGAKRIAAGFGYSDSRLVNGAATWHPWCHYPVGYSAYLSAFYKFLGATPLATHLANAIAGALLAVVTFLLAREALSPVRARIAGALVSLNPGLVLYSALVMTEPLSALLVLAAFYAALRVKRSGLGDGIVEPSRKRWVLLLRGPLAGGIVLGVAALVRPQALLCAPFLALTASGTTTWRARLVAAGAASGIALATVLPWTVRNCAVMDGCALVSTNAGWNLAIGAFPRATGRFETLRSSDGCSEVTGQVQQDRCWLHYGLSHIRQAPRRWLGLMPAKLSYTFDHESFAVEYLHEARPSAWPEPRRVLGREILTFVHRMLLAIAPLAFVGVAWPWPWPWRKSSGQGIDRRTRIARIVQTTLAAAVVALAYASFASTTPTFWPMVLVTCVLPWLPIPGRPKPAPALLMPVALLTTTALAHAIFFGEDRYHVVVTPVLCMLAAASFRPVSS